MTSAEPHPGDVEADTPARAGDAASVSAPHVTLPAPDAETPPAPEPDAAAGTVSERVRLYRYLAVGDVETYLAIMRLFAQSLLADLSAAEVCTRLTDVGIHLDLDTADDRLANLVGWGNLIRTPREVHVSSIAEYTRARSRYQISKLGGRVHREVDALISASEGAREVSSDLLVQMAHHLGECLADTRHPGRRSPADTAQSITTMFLQFTRFSESIRDLYAYLGTVLSRYDLEDEEFAGFKDLLLDYIESLIAEVQRHTPGIEADLALIWPDLPDLLALVDAHAPLSALEALDPLGGQVEREQGRRLADWQVVRVWFTDSDGDASRVSQLHEVTERALQSLLANLKRIFATSARETSRRADLLRLARWFDTAPTPTAHALYVAAFGLHCSRNLSADPGDGADPAPASTSWWHGPRAEVPVSLRLRGDRTARGRTSRSEDYWAQKRQLLSRAQAVARRKDAPAAELLAAAGDLSRARLTGHALSLLLDLTAAAAAGLGPHPHASATSARTGQQVILTLRRQPGARLTVHSSDGDLTLDDVEITLAPADRAADTTDLPLAATQPVPDEVTPVDAADQASA